MAQAAIAILDIVCSAPNMHPIRNAEKKPLSYIIAAG